MRIGILVLLVSVMMACAPTTHTLQCPYLSMCYDTAAQQCEGHWQQVATGGAAFPFSSYTDTQVDRDGNATPGYYTIHVSCKR